MPNYIIKSFEPIASDSKVPLMFSKAFAKATELSEKAATAANESLEKAHQVAKNSQTIQQFSAATADEHCSHCGRAVSVVQKATKQASIHHCRVCDNIFCDKCCRKTNLAIPSNLWNPIVRHLYLFVPPEL